MEIRRIQGGELPAAMDLCWRVFLEFEAPEYPPEGVEAFRAYLSDIEQVNHLTLFGAWEGQELLGVLAAEGSHIALFFVDPAFHRLIGEMLSISRMESGSAAVRQEPVDLSALMAQQLALDRELLEQRGQQLVSALTPGITVPADASLLGKAVGNLLSNASRYSPEGAEIRVWCGRLEGRPALSVENTGARVSGDALPHLFEAFYREEGSRNRSTGGSGLGLYLVKMILDRHGAVCTIENTEEGVKATVRF